MAQKTTALPQYRAFISYSHRDAAFGRRLHRRLEAYVVPQRLVGRIGRWGPVPRRLAPIFRDREDLPATDDLSAEVRAGLEASRCLIVVCSPAAKASIWVALEIELFRSLHPDRPILAALLEGEPALAFPTPLLSNGQEPLAADFRRNRDGFGLGVLKLASGLAGVALDKLIQRDAQRRIAQVTAISTAAVLTTASLSGFAVSIQRSREAERQRAEAEGLVEFMLTDLRSGLRAVGRLDILSSIDRRAVEYYAHQNLKLLPTDALEHRARTLTALSEEEANMRRFDQALALISEASRTTLILLKADPNNPKWILLQARIESLSGQIYLYSSNLDQAEFSFTSQTILTRRLLDINERNPAWLMENASAESNLGALYLAPRQDPQSAQFHFTEALNKIKAALKLAPDVVDYRLRLAAGYSWLGSSQRNLGQSDAAIASLQEASRILEYILAGAPANAAFARTLASNELELAEFEFELGRKKKALQHLSKARSLTKADDDFSFREEYLARRLAGHAEPMRIVIGAR